MTVPKVLALVTSCGTCANYEYNSGGTHKCRLADQIVLDKSVIAPFCPLADYPSSVIAGMDRTIRCLREPNKYVFTHALLTFVATKLNLNLDADGRGILITFKDCGKEREAYLAYDYIMEVTVSPLIVTFISQGKRFKVLPEGTSPTIEEHLGELPGLEGKDHRTSHTLQKRSP
ncbi:MAG: hypothetical protein ABIT47_03090 [Candidatus Paceibacterota bacterium]